MKITIEETPRGLEINASGGDAVEFLKITACGLALLFRSVKKDEIGDRKAVEDLKKVIEEAWGYTGKGLSVTRLTPEGGGGNGL